MIKYSQYIAATRFGLGVTARDLDAMGDDPQSWLLSQINQGNGDTGPAAKASHKAINDQRAHMKKMRRLRRDKSMDEMRKMMGREHRADIRAMQHSHLAYAVESETPFRERLVRFYSNHFTISTAGHPELNTTGVSYENETVRANIDGYFGDMVEAVAMHPAMLLYLDNAASIGPNSKVGSRRKKSKRGLNENLAREILELHTLGVEGGYTQDDVIALARIITGWTVGGQGSDNSGQFMFIDGRHEPGTHTLMDRSYSNTGISQGQTALRDIAVHPSTARFVATKLARHFVADNPPEDAVNALEQAFLQSNGHLPTVHETLVQLESIWYRDELKFKSPQDYVISALRTLQLPLTTKLLNKSYNGIRHMSQAPFTAQSPAGWPDRQENWSTPNAIRLRVEWAVHIGHILRPDGYLVEDMQQYLSPFESDDLSEAMSRAASPGQAIGLMLASPEFQWR